MVQSQNSPQYSEADEVTLRLADSLMHESVLVLKYGPSFLDELAGLARAKRNFDVIIIDSTDCGFYMPAFEMIEASTLARSMLEVQGALVFVKHDKAAGFIKESPVGYLSFHVFESFSAVYDYSTSIAKHIQQAMGQGIEIGRDSTDLAEQILLTAIPVLTTFGIKLKAGAEGSMRRNIILSAIDNYTPLSSIAQRLSQQLPFAQLIEELRGLEKSGVVFPIFPKIPFLVHHFRNSRPFKLKDYLLEAKLVTSEQLDEIIFAIQNAKGAQRLSLGALCVSKGLFSARQLEIALQDQAFFGQLRDTDKGKVRLETEQDTKVQSLIGNLATTEPAGVLQNLVSNRCNGVLAVEYRDKQFRALLEQGKLSFAKQGKLKGNEAVTEFVSVWKEGVYVFIERQPPPDLANDECKVTRPLDKLLLDSALASDNIDVVWKKFAKGNKSTLEKLPDASNLLDRNDLVDPAEQYQLSAEEIDLMRRVWSACDGLSSIEETGKRLSDLSSLKIATAIGRLMFYGLVRAPETDLGGPLNKFRNIISQVSQKVGIDRSEALLRIALRESQGYSAVARIFSIGASCEVGADIAAAKSAALSLSTVVKALEDWQVKYIEHVSQELDKNVLRDIVYKVYQGK